MQWWPIQLLRHLVILVCFWAASTPRAYIHQACQTCIALQFPGFDHWIFDFYIAFFEFYIVFFFDFYIDFFFDFYIDFSLIFILIFYLMFILIFAFSFPILFYWLFFQQNQYFPIDFFGDFGTILILLIVINIRCSGWIEAIWGWFPLLTMIIYNEVATWGRDEIYPDLWIMVDISNWIYDGIYTS